MHLCLQTTRIKYLMKISDLTIISYNENWFSKLFLSK